MSAWFKAEPNLNTGSPGSMDRMRQLTWEQYLSLCRKRETEGRKWISYDQAARQHRRPTSALRNRRSQSSTATRTHGPPDAGSLAPPLPAGRPRSRTPPRSISATASREVLFTESRRRLIPQSDSLHLSTDREEAFEADRPLHREDAEEDWSDYEEAAYRYQEADTVHWDS